MRLILAVLVCLFTATISCAATVSAGHPRLIIDADKKAAIIANCLGTGDVDLSSQYAAMKAWVDATAVGSYSSGNTMAHWRSWLSLVMVAMVESGANDDPYLTALEDAIASWETTNCASDTGWDYRMSIPAIIYDWLFDKLSAGAKQNVADLYQCWWDYNTGEGNASGSWSNHTQEKIQGFIYGSLALSGEGLCDVAAAAALTEAEGLIDEVIAATNITSSSTNYNDGGWTEGEAYVGRGGFGLLANVMAWNTATVIGDHVTSDSLAGMGKWLFHYLRNDRTFMRFNEAKPVTFTAGLDYGVWYSHPMFAWVLADEYNDGYSRYIHNEIFAGDGTINSSAMTGSYRQYYSFYIIWYNAISPTVPASETTTAFFDGVGHIMIRNGWTANTDWVFGYNHTPIKASGHQHLGEAGNFELSRDVGLIITAGAYEGGDTSGNSGGTAGTRVDTDYYQPAISKNQITVVDPDEVWPDYYNYTTLNQGGPKWGGPADVGLSPRPDNVAALSEYSFSHGSIDKFYSSSNTAYWRSDLTEAFARSDGLDEAISNSSKMVFNTREIIRSGDYFIVHDKVQASDANFKKRFLLHFVGEPTVSGSAGSTVYGATPYTGDNSLIEVANGSSKVFIKSLLPASREFFKVGGTGFEFKDTYGQTAFTDKVLYNEASNLAAPVEAGAWRVEISPASAAAQDTFLHVIKPGGSAVTMPTSTLLSGTGYNGVLVADSTENVVALFASAYSLAGNTSVSYTTTTTAASKHIISGMADGTYTVTPSVGDPQIIASDNGVVAFDITETGEISYGISNGAILYPSVSGGLIKLSGGGFIQLP